MIIVEFFGKVVWEGFLNAFIGRVRAWKYINRPLGCSDIIRELEGIGEGEERLGRVVGERRGMGVEVVPVEVVVWRVEVGKIREGEERVDGILLFLEGQRMSG